MVGSEYDSVIISGLAILGIRDDGGWVAAIDYTTNYSAVIKLARMTVVQKAHEQWARSIAASKGEGYDRTEAMELCESYYQIT